MIVRASLLALALMGSAVAPAFAQHRESPAANYTFADDVELGAPGFWDYLTFDPVAKRVYAAHYDKVSVFDAATGKPVGSIGPVKDAHGVVVVNRLGKGYAVSGEDGAVKVFNLSDLKIVKDIKIADDIDGAVLDPHSGAVLVVSGDGKSLSVINPDHDTVKTFPLPGKPEYLAADGAGKVYVNLADTATVAKVDIATGKVEANWPLTGCKAPHGLAYDARSHRLFSGCSNGRLVVVDAKNGRNVASLPIGPLSDGVVVDEKRGLLFSASAKGTLSVIREGGGDQYKVARTIPTFFGGRNLTIDPATGDIFVSHGDMKLETGTANVLALRFSWDGLSVARFSPE